MDLPTDNVTEDLMDNEPQSEQNNSNVAQPYWDLSTRIGMSSCLAVILIVALVGNAMVLSIIIRHRGMRTRTNLFLASLAVADLLVAVLDMPFSLTTMIAGNWIFGESFCVFNGFTMPLFLVTSIHTLMYISIHKYITITRPFSRVLTHRRVLFMIVAAWVWAAISSTTTVTGLTSVEYKPNTTQCGPKYPKTLTAYIQSGMVTVVCYIIPLAIMTFCYISMVREIIGYSSRLMEHSNQEVATIMRQQKRIIVTLFIVVALFFCCWTPYIVYSLYAATIENKDEIPGLYNPIAYWCGYLNSACNPIVYALRSPSFREGYREIFCQGPAFISDEMLDTLREESPNPLRRISTLLRSSFRSSNSVRGRQSASFVGPNRVSRASLVKYLQQTSAVGRKNSNGTWKLYLRSKSEHFIPMNQVYFDGHEASSPAVNAKREPEVPDENQPPVTCDKIPCVNNPLLPNSNAHDFSESVATGQCQRNSFENGNCSRCFIGDLVDAVDGK